MKVEIVGWDGVPYDGSGERIESGRELFRNYTTAVDLPKEETTYDFDVPKSAK
jgi:hypothetical protein